MIDPLETIITWLEAALISVSGRVAGKHRYGGGGWTDSQTGVSVHLDGGPPDLYAPVIRLRLELRIYADDQVKVTGVWRDLIVLSRNTKRFSVAISGGKAALVHYFKPASGLSIPYDEKLGMDVGVVFFDCLIGEKSLS